MGDDVNNLQAFLATTSAHGLAKLRLKDKLSRRIWMAICLLCYVFFLITIMKIIYLAMDPGYNMTKVTMETVTNSESLYFLLTESYQNLQHTILY